MKKLLLLSTLMIASCSQTATLLTPEYKLVKAPDSLYDCPTVTRFPKAATLTDEQVGKLLIKLQKNNLACKNSSEAVRKFYDDAEQTINDKK
jgi:hypothetical protein